MVVRFDEDLNHLLSSVISKYEISVTMGIKYDKSSFSDCIKNHIPDNFVFKAFPIQFKHLNSVQMFNTMQENEVARMIVNSFGDQIRFGLRCKVVQYPEDVVAVWVIIAAYYIEI